MTPNKYKCSCCGGNLNRATMTCEYCGTRYEEEHGNVIRIETFQNPVRTLKSYFELSDRYMLINNPREYSEYAIKTMARQFAEAIAPFMNVEYSFEPCMDITRLSATIKIIEPINKPTDPLANLKISQKGESE